MLLYDSDGQGWLSQNLGPLPLRARKRVIYSELRELRENSEQEDDWDDGWEPYNTALWDQSRLD
jgi:hypothetical protein